MTAVVAGMILLATPAGHVPAVAIVAFLWLGFFGIGWYGPWVAALAEAAPPDRTGFVLGSVMAVNQIAVIAAPPLLGALSDATHSFTPVWSLLAALAVAARMRLGRASDGASDE
jgi:MFS family permease